MREVWPELKKRFPELAIVCQLLHKNVLEPIINHQPTKMAEIGAHNKNTSFLSMVCEAFEEAGVGRLEGQRLSGRETHLFSVA